MILSQEKQTDEKTSNKEKTKQISERPTPQKNPKPNPQNLQMETDKLSKLRKARPALNFGGETFPSEISAFGRF